jgi:hypothetical protein
MRKTSSKPKFREFYKIPHRIPQSHQGYQKKRKEEILSQIEEN